MAWPDDDPLIEDIESRELDPEDLSVFRPSWLMILISALVILALLVMLIAPLLRSYRFRPPPPTPTPSFLREAQYMKIERMPQAIVRGPTALDSACAVTMDGGPINRQAQNHRGSFARLGVNFELGIDQSRPLRHRREAEADPLVIVIQG